METGNDIYGIFPMIIGSIYVTVGAIVIGVPIGILTSIFMAKYCPKKIYPFLKGATELLAGIPSVVYGFFGLVVIVPIVHEILDLRRAGILERSGDGKSILMASILLGMMILPTIIGVTESAIRAVPDQYYEGALALGATSTIDHFRSCSSGGKIGSFGRSHSRYRTRHRRDDGSNYGSGKSAETAGRNYTGCENADCKHRNGNGICDRFAQRGVDCNGSCSVCVYFNYQHMRINIKQGGSHNVQMEK